MNLMKIMYLMNGNLGKHQMKMDMKMLKNHKSIQTKLLHIVERFQLQYTIKYIMNCVKDSKKYTMGKYSI